MTNLSKGTSFIAAALLAMATTTVAAEEDGAKSFLDGPKYVGAGLGMARFTAAGFEPRLATGLVRGGMYVIESAFNDKAAVAVEAQFGFELHKDPLNTSPNNHARLGNYYGVWAKPEYRVFDFLVVYAAVGYADTGIDIEGSGGGEFTESGNAFGGGLRLNVSPFGNLNIDFMQYADTDTFRSEAVGITYNVNFGVDSDAEFDY